MTIYPAATPNGVLPANNVWTRSAWVLDSANHLATRAVQEFRIKLILQATVWEATEEMDEEPSAFYKKVRRYLGAAFKWSTGPAAVILGVTLLLRTQ